LPTWSWDLPPSAFAEAESASHEITRFDAELGGEIASFAAVLLRSESAASSQIENLTAFSPRYRRSGAVRCQAQAQRLR